MLPMPPSINHLYFNRAAGAVGRNGEALRGRGKTPAGKAFDTHAALLLARQRSNGIKGKVIVTYEVARFPDNRRRDVSNFEKALSDALVANGIIEDDKLIERLTIGWADGIEGVRVTVEAA